MRGERQGTKGETMRPIKKRWRAGRRVSLGIAYSFVIVSVWCGGEDVVKRRKRRNIDWMRFSKGRKFLAQLVLQPRNSKEKK